MPLANWVCWLDQYIDNTDVFVNTLINLTTYQLSLLWIVINTRCFENIHDSIPLPTAQRSRCRSALASQKMALLTEYIW